MAMPLKITVSWHVTPCSFGRYVDHLLDNDRETDYKALYPSNDSALYSKLTNTPKL